MSTVNKIAMNIGHSPKAAINSAVVKSFVIGAVDPDYAAAQTSNAVASVSSTLDGLGFDEETIARMLARRA